MKMLLLILFYSFAISAQEIKSPLLDPLPTERAQTKENIMPSPQAQLPTPASQSKTEEITTLNPQRWSAFASFSYLDTWLPGKMGASAVYGDGERTYELALQTAKYSFDFVVSDLGSITDSRIHLTTRSFTWGGSFNFQYGLVYNSFQVKLGDSFTASAVGASVDVLKVQSIGAMWGVGNRYNISKSFQFAVDWFRIFMPLKVIGTQDDFIDSTTDPDKKADAKEVIDVLSKTPTFSILHMELGYQF